MASVEGVNDKDAADALNGTQLFCDRANLPDINEDEIYFVDLIGMECLDEAGQSVGKVIAVENFGAGDLLEIKPSSGQSFYLSYTTDTVLKIDDKITVALPEIL